MPRSGGLDRVLLMVALTVHTLVWVIGVRPVALDPDAMNLAYGMHRFDITHFNPHAPGYLVYVWTLKAVHVLTGEALRSWSASPRFSSWRCYSPWQRSAPSTRRLAV